MRVISGIAKGRKLKIPAGDSIRPTAERVKEAVFSILQFDIEGRRVLDLFAGSGQLGIEAISRGAEHVTFVESDRKIAGVLAENIQICGFKERAAIRRGDALSYLRELLPESVDIIFADPPYGALKYKKILEKTSEFDILKMNGIMVFESSADEVFPESEGCLVRGREYRYGKVKITIYTKGTVS